MPTKNYFVIYFLFLSFSFLSPNAYTDHLPIFKKIIASYPINSFLEFGLGDATAFFLDNCGSVMSIEIITKKNEVAAKAWFNRCLKRFKAYNNWNALLYHCNKPINEAEALIYQVKDPVIASLDYLAEIADLVNSIFVDQQFDIAFVDPGIHLRGEIVNALFGKVKIIVAHDTNTQFPAHKVYYGWNKINFPDNYEKIEFKKGSGTTVWIDKELKNLIHALNK